MQKEDLINIIESLSIKRPCFHSEFDFQFVLAMDLIALSKKNEIRLEIPITVEESITTAKMRFELDILLCANNKKIGIELKYATSDLETTIDEEEFKLKPHKNNGARFDFLKDVYRLEQLKKANKIDKGYAIFLTNVNKFHSGPKEVGRYEPIDLFKRKIGVNETIKFLYNIKNDDWRTLQLINEYELVWRSYGKKENFQYLR
jgi:hypothetical protein